MNHTLRRWRNPAYRRAHRHSWPTLIEVLALVLAIVGIAAAGRLYDTMRMREDAQNSIQTTARVLACINGQRSLGEYAELDGSRWAVECSTFLRRVKS